MSSAEIEVFAEEIKHLLYRAHPDNRIAICEAGELSSSPTRNCGNSHNSAPPLASACRLQSLIVLSVDKTDDCDETYFST